MPSVFDGPVLRHAHPVFDLGECLFDRIEVWRVWWQEPRPGTGRPDGLTDRLCLVAAQIVHDHNVTRSEGGDQVLGDVGPEAFAIDRAVKDIWSRELVAAQSA